MADGQTRPEGCGASVETFHALTNNIPVGTYVTEMLPDGTRRFVFISNRLLQMLDLTRDEVFADWSRAFCRVHPDEVPSLITVSEASWNDRAHFFWEGRVVVRGETRWVTVEAAPRALPGDVTVWEGVVIDVTLRKQFEQQLQNAKLRELEQAVVQRRELEVKLKTSLTAAAVAHEINQPLSTILLDSQMALRAATRAGACSGEIRGLLSAVAAEAERVLETIERMRSLLRNVETAHEPVDIVAVIDSAVMYTRPMALEHDVGVEWHPGREPVTVMGDAIQLKVAIVNAIRNAIEAIAGSRPAVRTVRIDMIPGRDSVECRIADSGPGIAPDVNCSAPLSSTKAGGGGLGLFIIRTAVENHGGAVSFTRSSLGGAEVRISLPRAGHPKARAGAE